MNGTRRERVAIYLLLTVLSVLVLLPVVGVVLAAIQSPGEVTSGYSLPRHVDLHNFARAWRTGGLGPALSSSAIVAGLTVLFTTVCCVLSGYAFATFSFRARTLLFYLFLVGIVIPFEALIVPLYYDLRGVSLIDTYWAVILPSTALSIAFGTFWMRASFRSVPRALIEAARIDGASALVALVRVALPLVRPAVLTMIVLTFMWTWNDFLLSLVMLSNPSIQTAPLKLAIFQGQHTTDTTGLAAAAIIVSAPVVCVYLVLQRHFIRGIVSGAVKA